MVAAITGTVDSAANHLLCDHLAVIGPAQPCKKVDEGSGEVQRVMAQLSCLVVIWEHVVIVVPALTQRRH